LKPYRGNPAVRNFKGGGGDTVTLVMLCASALPGGALGCNAWEKAEPVLYSTKNDHYSFVNRSNMAPEPSKIKHIKVENSRGFYERLETLYEWYQRKSLEIWGLPLQPFTDDALLWVELSVYFRVDLPSTL